METIELLTDAAVADAQRDYLRFDRYVRPLVDVLTAEVVQTPLTIGIFGAWGSGKSSVIALTDDALRKHDQKFVIVHFNAWLHRKEPNMLIPLIHTLRDALREDPKQRFADSVKKIGDVLIRLGSGLAIKTLTADQVKLEDLDKLEAAYVERKAIVESQMRKLHEHLQEEANAIAKKAGEPRLVFFIDDLDRCEPDQIIDLFDSIKLFLDLKNAIFVIAADKEVVDRGVQFKYINYKFDSDRLPTIGAEYLEKMVQIPFQLLPLYPDAVDRYIEGLLPHFPAEQRTLLSKIVFPNPRKIKRILNAYALVDPMAQNLDQSVLLRLLVLQNQSGDIYWAAARQVQLLTALERVYTGEIDVEKAENFSDYKSLRDAVQTFCKKHYAPNSYLKELFAKPAAKAGAAQQQLPQAPFAAVEKDLERYFSVVGR